MLFSVAMILLFGLAFARLFEFMKLPRLIGMILAGILIGPHVLDLLSDEMLLVSADIRTMALVIILLRAGLTLDIEDLKKVGRPAVLMSFLPACFEILGMLLLAPKFLKISLLDAAIMGSVVAAVSPAVVVPKMINLIENKYGTEKGIPQMILAGASLDDVFVIVLFTAFTGLALGNDLSIASFLQIPVSIITGVLVGFISGLILSKLFERFSIRDTIKILILLSISFILVSIENNNTSKIGFSGLLAVMSMGLAVNKRLELRSKSISSKLSKIWIGAEIFLFVLVGAAVSIDYLFTAGLPAIFLIFTVLIFRVLGVYISLLGTKLNKKERIFTMGAYTPKATVQAAIGGVPLAMGLECGEIVLTVAVLAIIVTAPLGALFIDRTYDKLLEKN